MVLGAQFDVDTAHADRHAGRRRTHHAAAPPPTPPLPHLLFPLPWTGFLLLAAPACTFYLAATTTVSVSTPHNGFLLGAGPPPHVHVPPFPHLGWHFIRTWASKRTVLFAWFILCCIPHIPLPCSHTAHTTSAMDSLRTGWAPIHPHMHAIRQHAMFPGPGLNRGRAMWWDSLISTLCPHP